MSISERSMPESSADNGLAQQDNRAGSAAQTWLSALEQLQQTVLRALSELDGKVAVGNAHRDSCDIWFHHGSDAYIVTIAPAGAERHPNGAAQIRCPACEQFTSSSHYCPALGGMSATWISDLQNSVRMQGATTAIHLPVPAVVPIVRWRQRALARLRHPMRPSQSNTNEQPGTSTAQLHWAPISRGPRPW